MFLCVCVFSLICSHLCAFLLKKRTEDTQAAFILLFPLKIIKLQLLLYSCRSLPYFRGIPGYLLSYKYGAGPARRGVMYMMYAYIRDTEVPYRTVLRIARTDILPVGLYTVYGAEGMSIVACVLLDERAPAS